MLSLHSNSLGLTVGKYEPVKYNDQAALIVDANSIITTQQPKMMEDTTRHPCIPCSKTFGSKSSLWHHKQTATHQKQVEKQQQQQNQKGRKVPQNSNNVSPNQTQASNSSVLQSIPPPLVPRRMNTSNNSLGINRLQQQLSDNQSNITNYGYTPKL